MKKFLLNISIFFIAFCTFAYFLQLSIDAGLKKQKNKVLKDWNLIFSGDINADIIILGSSRARTHFNPHIIEHKTGKNCYNLGIEGGKTTMQYAKWQSFIKHNKAPKILVLNVDLWSLGARQNLFKKEQFLPYLEHDEIYNNLKSIDKDLILDKYIPLYRYHGYTNFAFNGLLAMFFNKIDTTYTKYKGFSCSPPLWNNDFEEFKKKLKNNKLYFDTAQIDLGLEYIHKFRQDCMKNNIQLILIHTPQYYELLELTAQQNDIIETYKELGRLDQVSFWDYSSHPIIYDTLNFNNSMHLNCVGAEKFSILFAEKLDSFIVENKIK